MFICLPFYLFTYVNLFTCVALFLYLGFVVYLRLLLSRGAVKALPDNCSVYRP